LATQKKICGKNGRKRLAGLAQWIWNDGRFYTRMVTWLLLSN